MKPRQMRSRKQISKPASKNQKAFFHSMLALLVFALLLHFFGSALLPDSRSLPGENEIFVTFIDVGQGDSILIHSRENAVLIDGGEFHQRNVVMEHLRQAGVRRLDFVVATHPHSDHIGSLGNILGRIEVGRVIMPDIIHNTVAFEELLESIESNNIPVTFPNRGDRLVAGIIELTVLAPYSTAFVSTNDASIVLRLSYGETSFLFTGDAESPSENQIISSGLTAQSNVLKVGHHGSRTSTSQAFLEAVNPQAAVITVGRNNMFGHPHRDVVNRLEEWGAAIYRTDLHGTIRMATNGRQIYVLDTHLE